MKRFIAIFLAVFFFGGMVPIPALLIYWYNEAPPVTYTQRRVLTPVVPPGGTLKIKVSSDVSNDCTAVVTRAIVDSSGVQTTYAAELRPLETDYTVDLTVPLGAAPGQAYYIARLDWQCNMVQAIWPRTVMQRHLPFDIAPSDGQMQMPEQQGIYQKPFTKSEYARLPQ